MGKILHIVLMKIAPTTPEAFTAAWAQKGNAMAGKIPGLTAIKCDTCIEGSKHRTGGWTHMLYSTFDTEDNLRKYATHPVHEDLLAFGKGKFIDKVVFDMEL